MIFHREWAMPSHNTFDIGPIGDFVKKYLLQSTISVDPFARSKRWATYTNDLNEGTAAEYHMDAEEFCLMLQNKGIKADLVIFDPPYSQSGLNMQTVVATALCILAYGNLLLHLSPKAERCLLLDGILMG